MRLGNILSQRWAITSQVRRFTSIKSYIFGQSNLNLGTVQNIESGQSVQVFEWQNKLGMLLKNQDILGAVRVDSNDDQNLNQSLNINDSEQETLVNDGNTLHLMWKHNNDEVMYQAFNAVNAMAINPVQNISNALYLSSNPSLTLTPNAITIAFVDERSQGAQP